MIYLIVFLILLIFILISKITVVVNYRREEENDNLNITFSYLKIFRYNLNIPFIDISKKDKEAGIKINSSGRNRFLDLKSMIDKIEEIISYYKLYTLSFKKLIRSLRKSLNIKILKLHLTIGVDDCALTAILVGFAYTLCFNGYSYLESKLKIKSHDISIEPEYNKMILKIDCNCIFSVAIGNIIYVGMQLLILFLTHKLKRFQKFNLKININ